MAISTTIQPKYLFRLIAITVVSLVLGLWGVYDYVVRIPRQQELFDHGQVYSQVQKALTSADEGNTASVAAAHETVRAELDKLKEAGTLDDPNAADNQKGWAAELALFNAALIEAASRRPIANASQGYIDTSDLAKDRVNETAKIEKPGTFDRITQIAFISCLLMIPYLLWQYLRLKRTVYRLEDDGSLQHPGGTIGHDAIAEVDMSRWMSKSIAFVVGSDGTRVKLDDYVFKNVDRIVGKLAHEREPTVWQEDARPVKSDDDDDDTIDGAEGDAPAEAETAPKD